MLAVISHDAGGAEVLSSYIRQQGIECLYVLAGPALKIFERKLGPVNISALDEAIHNSESILCGTSWQSDIEFEAIRQAHIHGKHSVAFLDHWVNYRERFIRSGDTCLPDELWVGDMYAETIANATFHTLPVKLVENPYVNDIRQEFLSVHTKVSVLSDQVSVLYVCEPVREHALKQYGDERYWGYTEEEALRYFLSNIDALGKSVARIIIRPHPSERSEKYAWVQSEFELPIIMGGSETLVEDVAKSDVVVGCESMAMVVGLIAKKRVISCIPAEGKACRLPHAEIQHLHQLI